MYSFFSRQQNCKTHVCSLKTVSEHVAVKNGMNAFARFGELRLVISHRGIPITQALKEVEKTNETVRQNAIEA